AVERTRQAGTFDCLHRAIGTHPSHYLRVSKLAARATYLPNTLIGLMPLRFEEIHQQLLNAPGIFTCRHAMTYSHVERIADLAVNIELKLTMSGVAHAHGAAVFVTRQPIQLQLGQTLLTHDAVHGLKLMRLAGDRTQQPIAPLAGFLCVT